MPELKQRPLGTDREKAPVNWIIHQMGSSLIGELFNGGYYRECLKMAEAMASHHRPALTAIYETRQSPSVDLNRMIAQFEDVSRWAGDVKSEGYHTVNTHVFITLWAAQEAGVENIIAEIIKTSKKAADIASGKFPSGKYSVHSWPWSESMCLEISQKLDSKAKNAISNGGEDLARRMMTLFSWFDLKVELDDTVIDKYNEASLVRNVIMHRYGYLSAENVANFPDLVPWVGMVLPITNERLNSYYEAVKTMYLGLAKAVWSSEYK